MNNPSEWPSSARLARALAEQGLAPEGVTELLPPLLHLAEEMPTPTMAETDRLIQRLRPLAPAPSDIRRALARYPATPWKECRTLLALARIQVRICRPAFWGSSGVIALIGLFAALGGGIPNALVLYVAGPLLGYLGVAIAFRGATLCLIECELACPPSPRQLGLARLVLVLGYDLALGLLGSALLCRWDGNGLRTIALHWLAPLLLVAGLGFALSLRLPLPLATGSSYAIWLNALLLFWTTHATDRTVIFAASTEITLALIGLVLLGVALYLFPIAAPRLLPLR